MNTKQENKFTMYLLVKVVLNTFNVVWAVVPGFAAAVAEFFAKITAIDGAVQVQETKITGYSKNKKTAKGKMAAKALEIAGALKKFATDTHDDVLYDSIDFTETELTEATDTIAKERCQLVFNTATTHAADILPEGILATDIAELGTLITAYSDVLSSPSAAKDRKKEATANVKLFLKDGDVILKKKLDLLMLQFKDSNPDFYNAYKNGWKIIDLGTQHTQFGGVVKNAEGVVLEDVVVSISGTDLVRITDVDGAFLFKPFVPGDFDITVEKIGFVTKTLNGVHISPGQHLVLDVVLEHLVRTGAIASGQQQNILGLANPEWKIGATVKIKNTTTGPGVNSIYFYPANNPGDGYSGQGSQLLPGQEETHTITAADFKAYLNIQNQSPNAGTWEITIL